MFRTGSTYIFNIFRRSDEGYFTYYEPFNELLQSGENTFFEMNEKYQYRSKFLKHTIKKPYFYEYSHFRDKLNYAFDPSFSFNKFYLTRNSLEPKLSQYIQLLLERAKGRPVLCFCRSIFRSEWLHNNFKSLRIYVYRNPRDQWASYQVADFFEITNFLTFESLIKAGNFNWLRSKIKLPLTEEPDLFKRIEFYRRIRLSQEQHYYLFYTIWALAFIKNTIPADIVIDMDFLSNSDAYKEIVKERLIKNGINMIDFSDCQIRQRVFLESENTSYSQIEKDVLDALRDNGFYSDLDLSNLPQYAYSSRQLNHRLLENEIQLSRNENIILIQRLRETENELREKNEKISQIKKPSSWYYVDPNLLFRAIKRRILRIFKVF